MSDATATCALWYWRYGSACYDLFDSEAEAAASAASISENDVGAIAGVQFADGRVVAVDDWEAYGAEEMRLRAEWDRQWAEQQNRPKPASRRVTDPFGTASVTVLADAPDWLGKQKQPTR